MKIIQKIKTRQWVQVFFFIFIALVAVNKNLGETGHPLPFLSQASLHALCPVGGVVTLYQMVTAGTLVAKIHMSSLVLMVLVFILALLFGSVFCGWVCPFGTLQEWISKLGKRVRGKRYNQIASPKIDAVFRRFRYVALIWILFVTAKSGELLFEHADPYNALFTFWTGEVALPSVIILIGTIIASLWIERPWCKYLCPYGALLGLFNHIRIFSIRRNKESCISCGKCNHACPMNLDIQRSHTVRDTQCISCMMCTSEQMCPVEDTVSLSASLQGKMRVKTRAVAIITFVVIFGGIIVASQLNLWATSNDRNGSGNKESMDVSQEVVYEDVSAIRGSSTFYEISEGFEIDLNVLQSAFVPSQALDANMKVKDLESLYEEGDVEIGRGSVQLFVAFYKGLTIETAESYLPESAASILLEDQVGLSEDRAQYVKEHTVSEKQIQD